MAPVPPAGPPPPAGSRHGRPPRVAPTLVQGPPHRQAPKLIGKEEEDEGEEAPPELGGVSRKSRVELGI